MEENKSTGKTIAIIILTLMVVGLTSFIIYDKVIKGSTNDNNLSDTKEIDSNKKNVKEIDINSDLVQKNINSFGYLTIYDEDIYKTGEYDIANIPKEKLVAIAVNEIYNSLGDKYLKSCGGPNKGKAVSIDKLNELLSKYVLNQKITMEDVKKYNPGYIEIEKDGVIYIAPCDDQITYDDYTEKNVVKAETEGDYLYIYEKAAFAIYNITDDNEDNPTVNYYKDYARTTILEKNMPSLEVIGPDETRTTDMLPNWDLYNTYKYTFKKVNNNYYFQNVKLEK